MIRLRTHLRNFGPHTDTTITWPTGMTALVAANGSGKTFALEAAIAAPYGAFPSRKGIGSIYDRVRHGCDTAEVSEDWLLDDGRTVRITRRVNAVQRTQRITIQPISPAGEPELDAEGRPVILAGPLAKDADPYIERLFGTEAIALASRFAAQNSRADLCYLSPTERRRAFTELTGTDALTPKSKAFGRLANQLEGSAEELERGILTAPDHEGEAARLRASLAHLGAEITRARADLATHEAEVTRLRDALANLDAGSTVHRAAIERHETARLHADSIRARIAERELEIASLRARIGDLDRLRADEALLNATRAAVADLESRLASHRTRVTWEQTAREIDLRIQTAQARLAELRAAANVSADDEALAARETELHDAYTRLCAANDQIEKRNRENQTRRVTLSTRLKAAEAPGIASAEIIARDRELAASVEAIRQEHRDARERNEIITRENADKARRRLHAQQDVSGWNYKLTTFTKRAESTPKTPFGEKCGEAKCGFLADWVQLPSQIEEAKSRLAQAESVLSSIPPDETIIDLAEIQERGTLAAAAAERIQRHDAAKAEAESIRAELATVPPDDEPLTDTTDAFRLANQAVEASKRVNMAQAAQLTIKDQQAYIDTWERERAEHHITPPANVEDPSAELAGSRALLDRLSGAHERLEASLVAQADANRASMRREDDQRELAAAEEQVAATAHPAEQARAAILDAERTRAETTAALNAASTLASGRRTALDLLIADEATARANVRMHEDAALRIAATRQRIHDIRARVAALNDLRTCFSEKGVQPIIIDAQAANLSAEVDRHLREISDGHFAFAILTQSANVDGTIAEDFIFQVRYPGGEMDVLEGSGGEIQIVRLIIRAAFGAWLARLKGLAAPSSLCLDESLAALDDNNRRRVCQMLARLAERFPQIIIVSHDDTMIQTIQQRIHLRKRLSGVSVSYEGCARAASQAGAFDHVANDGTVTADMFAEAAQ